MSWLDTDVLCRPDRGWAAAQAGDERVLGVLADMGWSDADVVRRWDVVMASAAYVWHRQFQVELGLDGWTSDCEVLCQDDFEQGRWPNDERVGVLAEHAGVSVRVMRQRIQAGTVTCPVDVWPSPGRMSIGGRAMVSEWALSGFPAWGVLWADRWDGAWLWDRVTDKGRMVTDGELAGLAQVVGWPVGVVEWVRDAAQ